MGTHHAHNLVERERQNKIGQPTSSPQSPQLCETGITREKADPCTLKRLGRLGGGELDVRDWVQRKPLSLDGIRVNSERYEAATIHMESQTLYQHYGLNIFS